MNATRFLSLVQQAVDDTGGRSYPISGVIADADQQIRGLYRTMIAGNKEWGNFLIALQDTAATQIAANVWEWRLPTWVCAVSRIWVRVNSATVETSFSPYRWTSPQSVVLGRELMKSAPLNCVHWHWDGQRTLRLMNYPSSAPDLYLKVSKLPPPLFKGKIATAHASANKLYIPATPSLGTVDIEEGAYVNAEFQVTETSAPNATHYGEIRRCVYSNAATIVSGVRYHELTFDTAFSTAPAADDIVETIVQTPDEHCRYLVLRTAQALMQRKNAAGLDAIQGELAEEGAKFLTYASSQRDTSGPTRYRRKGLVVGSDPENPGFYFTRY